MICAAYNSTLLVLQVWRDLALAYASQQQATDAQLCAQQMQQLEPHSAATYHALGVAAAASGDAVGAKQAYKAALALDAAYAPALLSLGAYSTQVYRYSVSVPGSCLLSLAACLSIMGMQL